jgi:cytochrome c-type biogenesis protein CcmH
MRCGRLLAPAVLAALVAIVPSRAVEPGEMLADAGLEARARSLSAELRCLVCQNQSIDDSNAPLARDLRLLVRERLAAGDSDEAVRRFVVARYGEFVLLRPPLGWHTALLWLTPALVIAGAGLFLLARRRSAAARPGSGAEGGLTAEEERRLAELLAPDDRPSRIAKGDR